MGVTLSAELAKMPCWRDIADYVNKQLQEENMYDSAFIRTAARTEVTRLKESGTSMLVVRREDGTLELVVGYGKYFNFAEIKESARLYPDKGALLMRLWLAQVVCLGKYYGGCDS